MNDVPPAVPARTMITTGTPPPGRLTSTRTFATRWFRAVATRAARSGTGTRAIASGRPAAARHLGTGPWRPLLIGAVFVALAMSLTAAVEMDDDGRSAAAFVAPVEAGAGGPRPVEPPPVPSVAPHDAIAPDSRDEPQVGVRSAPDRGSAEARPVRPERRPDKDPPAASDEEAEMADRMADHRAEMERMAERLQREWKEGR